VPFAPPALIAAAVESLKGRHPLAVVVVPAMVRAGVPVVTKAEDGAPYGIPEEQAVLDIYFRVPGGPPKKPYRAVWEDDPKAFWRDARYSGTSLQRIRTDRVKEGRAFLQAKVAGGRDLWGLKPSVGADIRRFTEPVRIVDLAIWYGREKDVADLAALVDWFVKEFPLEVADLVPDLYTDNVPSNYGAADNPFAPAPASSDELADAVGAAPVHSAFSGSIAELSDQLETCVNGKGFESSPRFVSRVVSAWLRGDMVILVGQPGTGKTFFSNLIGDCLTDVLGDVVVTTIPVRSDFDEGDLIGYEQLDGTPLLRDFATNVLKSSDPLGTHLVIFDEFNLATVEAYLASVLIAMEDLERRVMLPGGEAGYLPVDTFILATCNSYLDEPESRLRVSFPTKRRAAVIEMPNVLADAFTKDGDSTFVTHAVARIRAEATEVSTRVAELRATATDQARLAALNSVDSDADLSPKVKAALAKIGSAVMASAEGRSWFTLGILKDVALAVALAPRDETAELIALGEAVADKLVPQLRGPRDRADALLTAISDLPNRDLAAAALDRMKAGPTDQLQQTV
jgi:MoxR-like ATPase